MQVTSAEVLEVLTPPLQTKGPTAWLVRMRVRAESQMEVHNAQYDSYTPEKALAPPGACTPLSTRRNWSMDSPVRWG